MQVYGDAPKSIPDPFPKSDAYLDAAAWRHLTLSVFIPLHGILHSFIQE